MYRGAGPSASRSTSTSPVRSIRPVGRGSSARSSARFRSAEATDAARAPRSTAVCDQVEIHDEQQDDKELEVQEPPGLEFSLLDFVDLAAAFFLLLYVPPPLVD